MWDFQLYARLCRHSLLWINSANGRSPVRATCNRKQFQCIWLTAQKKTKRKKTLNSNETHNRAIVAHRLLNCFRHSVWKFIRKQTHTRTRSTMATIELHFFFRCVVCWARVTHTTTRDTYTLIDCKNAMSMISIAYIWISSHRTIYSSLFLSCDCTGHNYFNFV